MKLYAGTLQSTLLDHTIGIRSSCKQDERTWKALILLGVALNPPSTYVVCIFGLWCCVNVLKIILNSLCHLEGLAWWDWPFTLWTGQLLSFSALTLLVGLSDP